ncbi:DUF4864 domain-containing protein [Ahrensia kielensis]|uniref:DUF4864 domain-containing protein n=1 Tax=Ahrensia kielensis TaxID=76980 RepID=UPI0003A21EF3|nr:DUF4864 domain-containing protein [Ahrensia kielensis]
MIRNMFPSAFFALALLLTPATANAQSDNNAARGVITNQLEAFIARDFDLAYSFASDNIKGIFPTVEQFMAMVEGGYLPVLRPGNYAFGNTENLTEGRIKQDLLIRAPDGSDWTAIYYMQRQPDGSWKIDAVNLRKGAAGMT